MTTADKQPRDLFWIAMAVALIVFFFTVVYLRSRPGPAEQIALQTRHLELVHQVRADLAAVSEAQNSAVMSSADEDTQFFVGQARAAGTDLDRDLKELEKALRAHGNQQQLELMNRVTETFSEFHRLDQQLLELTVQNSNRKANALAFGPAAKVLQQIDTVLARIAANHENAADDKDQQITRLANETRISVLHMQVLLLPHIAEERENRMDELEEQIAQEDQKVTKNIEALTALLPSNDEAEIAKAKSLYADFDKLRAQIIKLSRENTNVRSLSLALNEKRKAMLAVEDSLMALERAIESEEVATTIPLRR